MSRGARRKNARPDSRLWGAVIALAAAVLAFPISAAAGPGLLVLPSTVSLGSIDTFAEPAKELGEGLSVFLPDSTRPEESPAVLTVSLAGPLTASGGEGTLPADRLRVGTDDLQPLPRSGSLSVPVTGVGFLRIRIGVQLERFDPPGAYEGKLAFGVPGNGEMNPVEIPVRFEARQWVAIRLTGRGSVLVAHGTELDSGASLSSDETDVIEVASNTRWRLLARQVTGFAPQTGPDERSLPAPQLTVRLRRNEWLEPVAEGFIRVGDEPSLLASGRPTGACADGWVPVVVRARLPLTRQQAAGCYAGRLEYVAETL